MRQWRSAVVAFLGTQAVAQELNLMGAGAAGFILGGGIGALVGGKHVTFRGDGAGWQRIARFGIGITGVLLFLGMASGAGVPEGATGVFVVALELAIFGSRLTLGTPWLFRMLRLSSGAHPS